MLRINRLYILNNSNHQLKLIFNIDKFILAAKYFQHKYNKIFKNKNER